MPQETTKANNCNQKDLYASVLRCPGQRVAPGIRPKILYAPKRWIKAWPTLPETKDADGLKDLAVLHGEFVLLADKAWMRIDLVDLKSSINSESQGEAPSVTYNNQAEFVVGGTDEEITGFCRLAVNEPIVYLVPERTGKYRLLGCEDFDPVTTVQQQSGAGITDQKQTTVSVSAFDYCPSPFYQGAIVTADEGSISGADDKAIAGQ